MQFFLIDWDKKTVTKKITIKSAMENMPFFAGKYITVPDSDLIGQ